MFFPPPLKADGLDTTVIADGNDRRSYVDKYCR
jgi:hypothetical protein